MGIDKCSTSFIFSFAVWYGATAYETSYMSSAPELLHTLLHVD